MSSVETAGVEQPEGADESMVARNLDIMNKGMLKVLANESMGGNAGSVVIDNENYPCAAVNGCANPETGEIIMFGNHIPDDVMIGNKHFYFRVAINFRRPPGWQRIVDTGLSGFTPVALRTMTAAVARWNESHQFIQE